MAVATKKAPNTKMFQKRIDVELYNEVDSIYRSLGISLTDAFMLFIVKSKQVRGLPFDLRQTKPVDVALGADWRDGLEGVKDEWE